MKKLLAVLMLGLSVSAHASVVTVRHTFAGSGWQMFVGTEPFIVRGISYHTDTIGQNPNIGNYQDWMIQDLNANGQPDGPKDSWVDANNNNVKDSTETVVGDWQLLKDMGANTIRIYHHPSDDPELAVCYSSSNVQGQMIWNHPFNKALMNDLFTNYGIRVAMGDEVGAYAGSSCAPWDPGTDYTDPIQLYNMRASVIRMVNEFKDEPWLLMYVLGNENNYPFTHTNAATHPVEYYHFIGQLVDMIHKMDPYHPVAIANGETQFAAYIRDNAPNVDIIGVNAYRAPGAYIGFGNMFAELAQYFDKPVMLTEFGLTEPHYISGVFDEPYQAAVLQNYWCDIQNHSAGQKFPGNAIGGIIYSWLDSWWQNGNENALYAGSPNNETTGLIGQGSGVNSPYQRNPKKAYYMFRNIWRKGFQCAS